MRKILSFVQIVILVSFLIPTWIFADGEKILIFRDQKPWSGHVPAVNACVSLVRTLSASNNFSFDTTIDFSSFTKQNLAKYDVVMLVHPMHQPPTGDVGVEDTLNADQDSALQSFFRSGKGLIACHDVDRFCSNWPWFHSLLGAEYTGDAGPLSLTFHVADTSSIFTKGIPTTFVRSQQVRYQKLYFTDTSKGWNVLIKGDAKDYPAGKKIGFYPFVWLHDFEGGRMFYGCMGHTAETYATDTI